MSGEVVELEGEAQALVAAVVDLAGYDFALVGGLAVMVRLRESHRVTRDLDSVFDNPGDVPTTATLVSAGVAVDAPVPQRVIVRGVDVDVIDTCALPTEIEALPDSPKDRLFVCAHRYAFETASPVRLKSGSRAADVRVATPAALIACKAHALRFATAQRRATKRPSDLHDVYRLTATSLHDVDIALRAAPWELRHQVAAALGDDMRDLEQVVAVLRGAKAIEQLDADDVADVLGELLDTLASPA